MSYTLNKTGAQIDSILDRADVGGAIDASIALKAPLNSPAFTGSPTAPTQTAGDNSTKLATTAYADAAIDAEKDRAEAAEALLAPKASPALTGTPTAPTAAAGTDTTQIATTAFVHDVVDAGSEAAATQFAPIIEESVGPSAVASFSDGADGIAVKSLTVDIDVADAITGTAIYCTAGTDLLSGKNWTDSSYYNDSGAVTPSTNLKRMAAYLPVVPGAKYFLQCANNGTYRIRVHEYDANRNWLRQIYSDVGELATWTASSDAVYIRMSLGKAATDIICYRGEIVDIDWTDEAGAITAGTLTYSDGAWQLVSGGTYALTGPNIATIKGPNAIWSGDGNSTVEYRADTKLYIDNAIASI